MSIRHRELQLSTRGEGEVHDLTEKVAGLLAESEISDGMALVFVPGSTAGVTTIEYEPGLVRDFLAALERFAPRDLDYAHDRRWHDGNGPAHVPASLLGPSLTVPVAGAGWRLARRNRSCWSTSTIEPGNGASR